MSQNPKRKKLERLPFDHEKESFFEATYLNEILPKLPLAFNEDKCKLRLIAFGIYAHIIRNPAYVLFLDKVIKKSGGNPELVLLKPSHLIEAIEDVVCKLVENGVLELDIVFASVMSSLSQEIAEIHNTVSKYVSMN